MADLLPPENNLTEFHFIDLKNSTATESVMPDDSHILFPQVLTLCYFNGKQLRTLILHTCGHLWSCDVKRLWHPVTVCKPTWVGVHAHLQ